MPKGGMNKLRSSGNSRAGLRDCPPDLREILQAFIETPALLNGLPPPERALREQQIATVQAVRAKRSAATKAGHEVRRQRETARLVDLLTDPDDERSIEARWEMLTDRQAQLVSEWCAAEEAREAREKSKT